MKRLVFYLEGAEEATYRRGTTTTTDRHVFARIPVAERTRTIEMYAGRGEVALPDGVMPTFDGGNNRIVWKLRVSGTISLWPDVREEYELRVRPPGGTR